MKNYFKSAVSRFSLSVLVAAIVNGFILYPLFPSIMNPAVNIYGIPGWLLYRLPFFIVLVPSMYIFTRKLPNTAHKQSITLKPIHMLSIVSVAFVCYFIGMVVALLFERIVTCIYPYGSGFNPLTYIIAAAPPVVSIIFGMLLLPMAEELFFREFAYKKLGLYGEKSYVLISAVIFAYGQPHYAHLATAFAIGILLAKVYAKTYNIYYCMALHIIINGYLMLRSSDIITSPTAKLFIMLIFYILMLYGIYVLIKNYRDNLKKGFDENNIIPVKDVFTSFGMICLSLFTLVSIAIRIIL